MQAEACPEAVAAEVEGLLRALHPLLADAVPTVADNAVGAAARVATAHAPRLPLAPLVREILAALPIKADFVEMMPVVVALGELRDGAARVHARRRGARCAACAHRVRNRDTCRRGDVPLGGVRGESAGAAARCRGRGGRAGAGRVGAATAAGALAGRIAVSARGHIIPVLTMQSSAARYVNVYIGITQLQLRAR